MTLIATIAAIVLVAVGVGYAYTASTQNSGNNADSEYITLVQGGEGAYRFSDNIKVEWDTVDKKVGENIVTEFTIPGLSPGAVADHMNNVYIKQLGNPISILTEGIGIDPYESLECLVQPASDWIFFNGGDHPTTFFLKVENNDTTTWFKVVDQNHAKKYSGSGWVGGSTFSIDYDDSENKYYDTTVSVYYGIDGGSTIAVPHEPGIQPIGPSGAILNYAFLVFTVQRTV